MTVFAESTGLRNPKGTVFSNSAPRQVRVPTNLIGKLLDHGKDSAIALKLLAIKMTKGDGFVLNEIFVKNRYRVNHKTFKAGIRLMKQVGVLDRSQPNHRTYAKERVASRGDSFVMLDESLLFEEKRASLVAFILAVKISTVPGTPMDFAKRIGVTSRGTAQKLAKSAAQYGCDIHVGASIQSMMICRAGLEFELLFKTGPAKTGLSKTGPAHSGCKEDTVDVRTPQDLKKLQHATRSRDRGLLDEDFQEREIVLANWRRSSFWRGRDLCADAQPDLGNYNIAAWHQHLDAYGGAPAHMKTMHSFKQTIEVMEELSAIMGGADIGLVFRALAYWVCKAHADGRKIRSLGFIAEPLARQSDDGDYGWCYAYPSRLPDSVYQEAVSFAQKVFAACKAHGIALDNESLLSTQGIEDLGDALAQYGNNAVVAAIDHVNLSRIGPNEGYSICRWSWFTRHIQVEEPKKGRGRR